MASRRERVRADGTISWEALYRQNGQQRSITFNTAAARDDWVNLADKIGLEGALEALEALEGGGSGTPTFTAYALADLELRDSSEHEKSRNRKWIEKDYGIIASLPLNMVTETMVRKWIRNQVQSGAAGKTIRNKHGFMASVFKAAVLDRGLPEVTINPCERSKLPRTDSGDREEIQALSPGEFARLLDFIPHDFRDFITISAALAPRFSETTALQVRAWHPEAGDFGEIRIFRAWKRQPSGPPIAGPPKTKKSVRTLPVDEVLAEIIERRSFGKDPDDLIFTMPTGTRIDHNAFYHRVWQPALRLANGLPLLHRITGEPMVDEHGNTAVSPRHTFYGVNPALKRTKQHPERPGILGKWPRLHDLRHTGAAWMVENTRDLQLVQEFLGHESITTTVDLYSDFLPHRRRAMVAGITASLAQAFPQVIDAGGDVLEIESR